MLIILFWIISIPKSDKLFNNDFLFIAKSHMMIAYIDKTAAMRIATRFLKQHFSVLSMDAVLEGNAWQVTAQIELYGNVKTEKISIDAATSEMHAHIAALPQ